MRIYSFKVTGRYLYEYKQRDTFKFTFYFRNIPTQAQVVKKLREFCSDTRFAHVNAMAQYINFIGACKDMPFAPNSGFGRPIFPILDIGQREELDDSIHESCYVWFDYHDVVEN